MKKGKRVVKKEPKVRLTIEEKDDTQLQKAIELLK